MRVQSHSNAALTCPCPGSPPPRRRSPSYEPRNRRSPSYEPRRRCAWPDWHGLRVPVCCAIVPWFSANLLARKVAHTMSGCRASMEGCTPSCHCACRNLTMYV